MRHLQCGLPRGLGIDTECVFVVQARRVELLLVGGWGWKEGVLEGWKYSPTPAVGSFKEGSLKEAIAMRSLEEMLL